MVRNMLNVDSGTRTKEMCVLCVVLLCGHGNREVVVKTGSSVRGGCWSEEGQPCPVQLKISDISTRKESRYQYF